MSSSAINPALYRHLNFNFVRDAEPVASIARIPLVMEVNPAVPAKSVPEFVTYAKANPGKINLASGGPGTPLYVAGALFSMMADIKMTNVWYRGGEGAAMPDLLSGQVQAMFGVVPSSLAYVRSGSLRALTVTTAKRQPVLPDVPSMILLDRFPALRSASKELWGFDRRPQSSSSRSWSGPRRQPLGCTQPSKL